MKDCFFLSFMHSWYITLVDVFHIDTFLIFPIALTICEVFSTFFELHYCKWSVQFLFNYLKSILICLLKENIIAFFWNCVAVILLFCLLIIPFLCFHGILLSRPLLLSAMFNTESHAYVFSQCLQMQVHVSMLLHNILIKTDDGLNVSFLLSWLRN